MGTVYVGYDPFADRNAALKMRTLPELGDENATRMARTLFFLNALRTRPRMTRLPLSNAPGVLSDRAH